MEELKGLSSLEKLQAERAEAILHDLGMTWEQLQDKKVLDIGAGLAEFAQEAKKHSINVVSLEKQPEIWEEGTPSKDVPYIQGDAKTLPFQDNSFDVILSRAAPPTISHEKDQIIQVLKEVNRVLKIGGEFHFGPGNLNATVFTSEELFTPEETQSFSTEQRIKRIREKSIEFLQQINPNIEERATTNDSSSIRDFSDHYYILRKEENSSYKKTAKSSTPY